jgi:NADH-quinone oxidoreductase subunit C
MDPKAIYEKLKARHGDRVLGYGDQRPDPSIRVQPAAIAEISRDLKGDPELQFDFLECLSGMDYGSELGVTYHVYSYPRRHRLVLNVRLDRSNPVVPSVDAIWAGANWHEREAYDLFGIVFEGSRDLRRILLPEDWPGYPLRKDDVPPNSFQGTPLR